MFKIVHSCISVTDLDRSVKFYEKALGLKEVRRKTAPDGSYILIFLGDGISGHQLELSWLRDWEKDHYDLGDNEIHIGFITDDYEGAHKLHQEMGCICFENPGMGVYFIEDPDGFWMEVIPRKLIEG